MTSITSALCPISQRDQPDSTEGAILKLLCKWQTRLFFSARKGEERGTLAVLVPFDPHLCLIRIPLYQKCKQEFMVGSEYINHGGNDSSSYGRSIGTEYCVFSWDSIADFGNVIEIAASDHSICGILVNGERVRSRSSSYLQDQDIITFVLKDQPDYRYVFRYAVKMPTVQKITITQPGVVVPMFEDEATSP